MNDIKKISFALAASFLLLPTAVPIVNAENNDSAFLRGDINSDGEFNVADVAVFQRWLLGDSFYGGDMKIDNWKAADLCNDGRLDVFDLCLMKQELFKNGEFAELPTLVEISEMSNEEATELFSKYTFQDIESIWRKFDYYHSGLYGGGWEIGDKK